MNMLVDLKIINTMERGQKNITIIRSKVSTSIISGSKELWHGTIMVKSSYIKDNSMMRKSFKGKESWFRNMVLTMDTLKMGERMAKENTNIKETWGMKDSIIMGLRKVKEKSILLKVNYRMMDNGKGDYLMAKEQPTKKMEANRKVNTFKELMLNICNQNY